MDSLWKDLRFAVRVLWKSPGFTAIALLALVLGIGANTAIFSVVNAVLLRPMPFQDPDRLVIVWEKSPRTKKNNVANPQNFADWRARNRSFEAMAGYLPFQFTSSITGDGPPEEVPSNVITREFFPILGVQPALGRNFLAEEDVRDEHANTAIISDGLWRRRYGADRNIIGKKLIVRGTPTTVVGVLPATFRFPEVKSDIWILQHIDAGGQRRGRYMGTIARLKPGVSLSQAQADMKLIAAQLATENPAFDTNWGAAVVPMREQFTGNLRTPLLVLLGAVGLVLLIACANVANLTLMRSSARTREMAIRTSLGATRGRIVRQLLVESTILGATGGLLGLMVAVWAKDFLLAMLPESMSVAKVNSVTIDNNVLAFTVILSLATGLLFGLLPALRAARPDLSDSLKEGGRAVSASLSRNRMRAALVAGEMAVALMLLIGAGLLMQSFVRLHNVAPGFQPERILSMHIGLSSSSICERPPGCGRLGRDHPAHTAGARRGFCRLHPISATQWAAIRHGLSCSGSAHAQAERGTGYRRFHRHSRIFFHDEHSSGAGPVVHCSRSRRVASGYSHQPGAGAATVCEYEPDRATALRAVGAGNAV